MLENYLVQTCSIVGIARNQYGDFVKSTLSEESCRFREVSVVRQMSHQAINDSDAMLWLKSSTIAVKGSIILFEGVYYQIERITKARKLGSSVTEFVKCDLRIYDISIS